MTVAVTTKDENGREPVQRRRGMRREQGRFFAGAEKPA